MFFVFLEICLGRKDLENLVYSYLLRSGKGFDGVVKGVEWGRYRFFGSMGRVWRIGIGYGNFFRVIYMVVRVY